ncbi:MULTISPECIES: hypothetical protein [Acetobacter]|mgnify:FL=1|uniref:Uncharacterized protein n=2 Tax=Acetobacter TaxID=434 RepID=A0A0U5EUB9_9PROT|nr:MULTISPECIES: hypothetical protein [Acetobacter]ATJ90816.1 hypothetical protein CIW82_09060 [Acetobacter tropicalis]MCG4255703.1 hypothetical protein [Acetobacter senegalensis]MCG4265610.1 hypothetical protein [Acetobacter senegalensis]MPQ73351.1 hypothetical protein [Acetobacter senegalensis]CEF40071.1 hypothetical protein predicted by Glimmer/Critica [Acetobacter senegalensis]
MSAIFLSFPESIFTTHHPDRSGRQRQCCGIGLTVLLMPVACIMAHAAPASSSTRQSGSRTENLRSSAPKTDMSVPNSSQMKPVGKEYFITAPAFSLQPEPPAGLNRFGAVTFEQSNRSFMPLETGRTVTAAYPVKGVPGMDLTVSMFAGHRETNTGSDVGTAAVIAGMRFKW